MDGNGLQKALSAFIVMSLVIAFALGGLTVWGLPKLWQWVKPIIHAATG